MQGKELSEPSGKLDLGNLPASPGSAADFDSAFERLFERYYRPIHGFFSNRGFGGEDCRDMAQETFLGVYRSLRDFRKDASEETWLFSIATNVWRNRLRRRSAGKRQRQEISLALVEADRQPLPSNEPGSNPLHEALDDEKTRMLQEAIRDLPTQMQRCIFLRVEQDLKYREIATIMQISIDTVKSQLFQARARLRNRLGPYFEDLEL